MEPNLSCDVLTIDTQNISYIEEVLTMTIRVHLPQTDEGKRELAKTAAAVHADMIIKIINEQDMAKERKQALLDTVMEKIAIKGKDQQEMGGPQ